jgi:hypothetical protein
MEWSTERLWSAISLYFLGFSEVVVFRVVQNSESNDLYPLSIPVLYEFCVCFQHQYNVDLGWHAKWMQLAQNCSRRPALVLVVLNLQVLAPER